MGVDIYRYLDHDLPTDNIESFVNELKKRVNSENIVLETVECVPEWENKKDDVWYIFIDPCDIYNIFHNELEFSVYKKALEVRYVEIDGKEDSSRWPFLLNYFESEIEYGKKWINGTIKFLKQNFVPIFHSTKLLVLADNRGYRHEFLDDCIEYDGKTIDEAIELNKKFDVPCKVYTNEEAIGIKESDYWDGEIGPIFLFDLKGTLDFL